MRRRKSFGNKRNAEILVKSLGLISMIEREERVYRGNVQSQTQRSDMKITAQIMQTYHLLKFALARCNGSTLLKIPPSNTT